MSAEPSTRARLLIFLVKNPALSHEEFYKKWLELGAVFKSLDVFTKNIRRYEQYHVDLPTLELLKKAPGLVVPDIDGIALFEADNFEKLMAPFGSEDVKTKIHPLEPAIFDIPKIRVYPSTFSTPLNQIPSSPSHPGGAAVTVPEGTPRQDRVTFVVWTRKDPSQTLEDFLSWWKGSFVDAFISYPKTKDALLTYEQSYLCAPIAQIMASRGRKAMDVDGVVFSESETFEGALGFFASEDFVKSVADKEKGWVDVENSPILGFRQVRIWEY